MSQQVSLKASIEQLPYPVPQMLLTPNGWVLIGATLALLWMNLKNKNSSPKGLLGRSVWASEKEKAEARKMALSQIESLGQTEELALFIRTPNGTRFVSESTPKGQQRYLYLPADPQTIYIPNAQENVWVMGRSGSGKTFSAINPMVMAAIIQGCDVFFYDFKGHEDPAPSSKLLGFAEEHGHKISMLAPGFPESGTCNLLDFLNDPRTRAQTAYEIANILRENFRLHDSEAGNSDFFDQSANQLIQAILMLAKSSLCPDIATCHKILALPNLIGRIKAKGDDIDPYIKNAFDQFLSSEHAPETASSIAATASLMFSRFVSDPLILNTFATTTTLPLDVNGRNFIVFKADPNKRTVTIPLLASILNLMVNRNIFKPRRVPLVVVLDELPSIKLPMLLHWLNQNRSSKFCAILGAQTIDLTASVYGKSQTTGIIGGCTTHFIFQLNDRETAEYYSALLGPEEVNYKQKSRSRNHGEKGGSSTSVSDHRQTRSLVEVPQLTQLNRGSAILFNSGYQRPGDFFGSRIPVKLKIVIPGRDRRILKRSTALWPPIRDRLIQHNKNPDAGFPAAELKRRERVAAELLPDAAGTQHKKEVLGKI
ncbi:type IV secretory system conjugative DNA transfer family protein [Gloeothece verrucosa]|uniref:TraD/TraG TraM recognition site domain-containing protein n=1 Tax=Gloeothece verrucosa (strain PCC 7822) TaxID=497965 RepID=E0UMN3_GLOV7|nr:TraM recognition domain-containing protein [Gloeothece verrucosa]ADN18213.1 conserved hypothetical protein [Gloeothece verrucosa PCC 7822]